MMVEVEKDCILFKLNSTIQFNNDSFCSTPSKTSFEKYEINEIDQNKKKIIISWLDPVRIRNKIIARDQISVNFIYFKNSSVLACFGGSESYIEYAINKIERK
ncbi:hypothetical protein V7164_14690, partial [Bacillus sp. JJ1474]